ncbi:hypothetical protein VTI74DRAFT_6734 [Chaetomium olivicolor]
MQTKRSTTTPSNHALAETLLYGFDISDEETRHFLNSLIASGQTPQAELQELHELSLMRGVEEWEMLFDCAEAIRARKQEWGSNQVNERSLVPFLEATLRGKVEEAEIEVASSGRATGRRNRATASNKKRAERRLSHFFGDHLADRRKPVMRQQHAAAFFAHNTETSSQGIQLTVNGLAKEGERAFNDDAESRVRTAARTSPSGDGDMSISQHEDSAFPSGRNNSRDVETYSVAIYTSPDPHPEPTKEPDRAFKPRHGSKSPFFTTITNSSIPPPQQQPAPSTSTQKKKPRPARGTISSLPIPPLSSVSFGLIQEELADDPFRLLIAITFLIRTTGKQAIPVFRELMARFPTPEALAAADPVEITDMIRPLGLSAVRCTTIQRYARTWIDRPPTKERRYGVRNYPNVGDGKHVRMGEVFGEEDGDLESGGVDAAADARERAVGCAWEIGHLTQGPYALDSWRIFCRDVLLGRSDHWTGMGREEGFQPEWMRVLPRDKELRACLRWMWMREGWEWDPLTGEREPLREEMRRAVNEGRVGYDDTGDLVILDQVTSDDP